MAEIYSTTASDLPVAGDRSDTLTASWPSFVEHVPRPLAVSPVHRNVPTNNR